RYDAYRPDDYDGLTFTATQARTILEPLAIARQQSPAIRDTYELASVIWQKCATAPSATEVAFLLEGLRYFPTDGKLVESITRTLVVHQLSAPATTAIEVGLRLDP